MAVHKGVHRHIHIYMTKTSISPPLMAVSILVFLKFHNMLLSNHQRKRGRKWLDLPLFMSLFYYSRYNLKKNL